MSTATITWQISGKELISFLHAKNNKIYKSNAFYLNGSNGSSKFMLECYSNGMNKGEEGSVDLFVKILSLPEHASDITLRYSLQCIETNTSFTKIKTFNRETTNSCWPYNTLQLTELCKLNIVTFQCDLQILSIKYKKTKSVIGVITNYFSNINIRMNKHTSFTWNIFNIEYDNFMNCKCRKQINSPLFGGDNDHKFYQLECYPNGTKLDQRGNVVMGLSLLLLPPLISSIKLFYSFECIQYNKEWSNVHNFNYNQSVKGWPIGLIKQDMLYKVTKKNKHITFKCHIEILKLYDNQNQEIHQKYWQRFIVDNTNHMSTQKHYNNNQNSMSYEQKDMEIAKLTQNMMNLQQTVDIMKKEMYSLQKTHNSNHKMKNRPKLQASHSDLGHRNNNNNNNNHNRNININRHNGHNNRNHHSHSHYAIPQPLPPLNVNEPPQYFTDYYPPKHGHNYYAKDKRHPRSRTDVDQLSKHYNNQNNNINNEYKDQDHIQQHDHIQHNQNHNHKHREFYPYNNSQSVTDNPNNNHNNNNNNNNIKTFKKRKVHRSVNGLYDYKYKNKMAPLDDNELNMNEKDNNYKNWYKSPYVKEKKDNASMKKDRKKTDEGFAENIRSFVQINDLVKNDLVKQMETSDVLLNNNSSNNSNPFMDENTNTIKINETEDEESSLNENDHDHDDQHENKSQIIYENIKEGNKKNNMNNNVKSKSIGTPKQKKEMFVKKSKSAKHEKYEKKHVRKRSKKHRNDKSKAFHRSQSEKKIYFHENKYQKSNKYNNYNNYYNNNNRKPVIPRFVDEYENVNANENQRNYTDYDRKFDRNKVRKWLCDDLGFSVKYFNLFMQNGYDNMDIIVELKERDLIQMGIHNKKYRHKLLKEFARFNSFQQETMGGHYI